MLVFNFTAPLRKDFLRFTTKSFPSVYGILNGLWVKGQWIFFLCQELLNSLVNLFINFTNMNQGNVLSWILIIKRICNMREVIVIDPMEKSLKKIIFTDCNTNGCS